eukprot:Clim_evm29s198 gene=Clim_evmTU29s198
MLRTTIHRRCVAGVAWQSCRAFTALQNHQQRRYATRLEQKVTVRSDRGPRLRRSVPDDGPRLTCPECNFIYYENPKIIVGTVAVYDGAFERDKWKNNADGMEIMGKILLCRRNIEPRRGFWTLPAGYMELGETAEGGALRETLEEAGVTAESGPLLGVFSLMHAGQVQLFYGASVSNEKINPGVETIEAKYFAWDEIPWDKLAFPTVTWALNAYRDYANTVASSVDPQSLHTFTPHGNPDRAGRQIDLWFGPDGIPREEMTWRKPPPGSSGHEVTSKPASRKVPRFFFLDHIEVFDKEKK